MGKEGSNFLDGFNRHYSDSMEKSTTVGFVSNLRVDHDIMICYHKYAYLLV